MRMFVRNLNDCFGTGTTDLLGGGWVKSIRAGGHFDVGAGFESMEHATKVLTEGETLPILLKYVRCGLEELVLTRFVFDEHTVDSFCLVLGQLSSVKNLTLSKLACSAKSFKRLMQGIADNIPELRYLDISANKVSRESADVLKDVITRHPKLVYLDVGLCEMDMHSYDSVLDGCEVSGRIQALNVRMTVAHSN